MAERDYLTARQAANYLKSTEKTLKQWRYAGRGPAYVKRGGRILYLKTDLDTYLAGRRVQPGVSP